jgi:hypothetical protein
MRPVMSPSPAARRRKFDEPRDIRRDDSRLDRHSGIQIPRNQKPQLLKSGLKSGCTQLPL